MNRSLFLRATFALSLGLVGLATAHAQTPATIDKPVENFRFRNQMATGDGDKMVALDDYKGNKIVVVVFVANRCGMTWSYEQKILALYRDYAKKGVVVLAIHSAYEESDEELVKPAKAHHWQFPVLDDKTQAFADYMKATSTPTFAIIDKAGILRYKGGFDRPAQKLEYVRPALNALLAGKPVAVKTTRALGCDLTRKPVTKS